MIYLEPSTLGWRPMLKSWLNTLPEPLQTEDQLDCIFAMFEWLVDPCLTFVKKSCKVCVNFKQNSPVFRLFPIAVPQSDCGVIDIFSRLYLSNG